MACPPSYEEVTSGSSRVFDDGKVDTKEPQRFSIRDEVGTSRSQHVAALVARLLPQIRERAQSGLSKSVLLLIPSDQGEPGASLPDVEIVSLMLVAEIQRRGDIVSFPDGEMPIMIQLEGRHDTLEFWAQQEALALLQAQMLSSISDDLPASSATTEPVMPPRVAVPSRNSFFGRKQSRTSQPPLATAPLERAPVQVTVQLDEVSLRTETEYGLYETLRSRAILVVVKVR